MTRLSPCAQCHRHVRAEDTHCPFCHAPHRASVVSVRPPTGLKRAALFALSTAAASTSVACGADDDDSDGSAMSDAPSGMGGGPGSEPTVQPVYGAPVEAAGGSTNDTGGSGGDTGGGNVTPGAGGGPGVEEPFPDVQPLYGAPPSADGE